MTLVIFQIKVVILQIPPLKRQCVHQQNLMTPNLGQIAFNNPVTIYHPAPKLHKVYEECKFLIKFYRVPFYTGVLLSCASVKAQEFGTLVNRLCSDAQVLYQYLCFHYKVELQNLFLTSHFNQE